MARPLGGGPPSALGWLLAVAVIPVVLAADAVYKAARSRRSTVPPRPISTTETSPGSNSP